MMRVTPATRLIAAKADEGPTVIRPSWSAASCEVVIGQHRPARVLHLVYMLRMAGTELGVVKLVNGLDRTRVVSAVCSCKPADGAKGRLDPEIPLFEFNRRDGNDLGFVLQLARLFRRERPDIVHTHSWGTLCEGLIAARLARVPFVIHGEHGTMETRPRNLLIQRWAWGRADCVLSVSSRLAERMSRNVHYPLARIRVIRNGIDTARFHPAKRPDARRHLGIASDDVVVTAAGRLVPVKDHATLLNALAQLKARGLRPRTIIAGDGPLGPALRSQAAALGIGVDFLGSRGDIERVLAASDVFVLSSVSEGLPNTVLEAMATGLPVISTRVGGADELVIDGQTGLLVPAGNPLRIAEALEHLVRDEAARKSMGQAGRRRVEAEFSLRRMTRAYQDLYLKVGARGRATDNGEASCVE